MKKGSRSRPLGGAGGPAGVRGRAPRGGRTCKVKGQLVSLWRGNSVNQAVSMKYRVPILDGITRRYLTWLVLDSDTRTVSYSDTLGETGAE